MPADSGLNVVLGATGGVGAALVRTLAREGRQVRAVSRRVVDQPAPGVEYVNADIATQDGAQRACAGAAVVFHAAQPPYHRWAEEFPAMTAAVIASAASADAKLVMVDNLYMYGPSDGPLTEALPRAAKGRKGVVRAKMEEQLLDAHRSGRSRVTIGRLSDYYGPHGTNSAVSALVLGPAAVGKAMRWVGSTSQPHTLHFVDDAARGLIVLADHDTADGAVWHLPAAPPMTGSDFMRLVNENLPAPVRAGAIGPMMMRISGVFSRQARESVECLYQWTAPFVVDSAQFETAFGGLPTTPHAVAVPATLRWMSPSSGSS